MATRHAFVIAAPIAIVGVAIAFMARSHDHEHVRITVRHDAAPIAVKAPPVPELAFISLVGLGDDEMAAKGFSLSQPSEIGVYAIGEGTSGGMVDFGWILNADTRQPVWQMKYGDTHRAGGASKNRMVDEVIALDAGNYIAYYMTDWCHSVVEWNARAPKHKSHYGMTLYTLDDTGALDVISEYDPASDQSMIAQIIHIRDDDERRQRFTLESDSEVRIYALGEGGSGGMYDYAWIENVETGRALWEMSYRITEHAGGTDRNRVFDGNIVLNAGEYVLRYEADGSHSLEGWSGGAPHDLFNYGVTLFKVEN